MPAPTAIATPTERTIRLTRDFDAPVDLVWDAFTKPEILQRWLGLFGDWKWVSCHIDLREGGSWRYEWRQADGDGRLVLQGVYREVVPGERIVMTQVYEGMDEFGEMLVTTTFRGSGDQTTVEEVIEYPSKEARDIDVQQMPSGLEPSFQNLDALLPELR